MTFRFLPLGAVALISTHAAWAQTVRPLPLGFEAAGSQFRARAQGYTMALDSTGASLRLPNARVLRFELEGAAKRSAGVGSGESAGVANYLIGNDPSLWRRNVPRFSRVKYSGVYPGIDLIYYGQGGQLEFDVVVAPGADPNAVRFRFEGQDRIRATDAGGLRLDAAGRQIELKAPLVYQTVNGSRRAIPARFVRRGAHRATLRIAAYDRALPLVIDPTVTVDVLTTTYIGGSGRDFASCIATDPLGNVYVGGTTGSADFPVTPGALAPPGVQGGAAFIVKLNPAGDTVYSTYINGNTPGGASGAYGLAVNSAGDVYLAGTTNSNSFPVTPGAYQSLPKGIENGFALELNAAGSALTYATLFGGSGRDQVNALAVDASGNAFVAGFTSSTDYPATKGAFQTKYGGGSSDGILTAINPTGTGLVFSTYLGTPGADQINGLALDGNGSAYVVGQTDSTVFPVTPGAFQTANKATLLGNVTGFVAHFSFDGTSLINSTYLGGSNYDFAQAITLDPNDWVYVTGGTASTDFPITPGAYQPRNIGFQAASVTLFDPALATVTASTYLGGSGQGSDVGYGITLGPDGAVYLGGQIGPQSIPGAVVPPNLAPGNDVGFFTALTPDLTGLVIPVTEVTSLQGYVDGVVFDPANNIFWMSLNGESAVHPTNTPKALLSINSEPPAVGFVPTAPDPIIVTKTLISPAGVIHQGDRLVFQVTITNTTAVATTIGINDHVLGTTEGVIQLSTPSTEFLETTAGELPGAFCVSNPGKSGHVQGYVQGYNCGVTIAAGASIVITDTYRATFDNDTFTVEDSNIVEISSNNGAGDSVRVYAEVHYAIAPPPVNCGSSGSSRRGASATTFSAPADAGSCPVSGTTSQTINFNPLPDQTTGASPMSLTATATSQLPITYETADDSVCSLTGSTVTITGAGSCFITAEQAGNSTYMAAPSVSQVFSVHAPGGPMITPGGIGPVYSSSTTIQAGSWISIYGMDLAAAPATWTGNFPTNLGGVTVTINGKNAYLWYVSPTQINLQAPDDNTTGVVGVTVTTTTGSWTSTVTLGPIGPSFSLLDAKHVAGIILRSDNSGAYGNGAYDIIGPTGDSLGYGTVAAKEGDVVELFGVGFGPTNPVVLAGRLFTGAASTTNPVHLTIGSTPVTPSFAGLTSAGLYQINLTIPAGLGTGDVSLAASVGGAQTPSQVVISLQ